MFSRKFNVFKINCRVLVLFVLLLSLLNSNQVFALDFSEAYAQLLRHNLSYRRAKLDLEADRTLIAQARANLLPTISASASTGFIRNDVSNLEDPSIDPLALNDEQQIDFDGETRRREDYGINLRQPIYNRALSVRLRQAKSQVLESELRLQRVLDEQLLNLAEVYLGLQQAKLNTDISQRELDSINAHRLLTNDRQQIGLGTKSDALEALSRYKTAQVDLLEDQKRIELFRKRLQRILRTEQGSFSSKMLKGTQFAKAVFNENINTLIKKNIDQNIDIRLQKHVVESAKLAVKLDRVDGGLTLDLVASSRRTKTEAFEAGDEDERSDDRVLLELNLPLFAGFGKSAKIRESKLRYEAEQLELENEIDTQSERIHEAYRSKEIAYKKMQSLEEAFLSSDKALKLREEGFLEGLTNGLEVLNAFRDKHRSERSWREAQFEYLTEFIRLNIALGKVSIEDIKLIDEYFQEKEETKIKDENKSTTNQQILSSKVKELSLRQRKEKPIREFINNWEKAWEEGDTEKYLSFYSNSFQPEKSLSFSEWQSQRKKRVRPEKKIELSISDLDIDFIDGRYGIQISFKQNYYTDNFSDQSKKEILIQSTNNGYEILSEVEL